MELGERWEKPRRIPTQEKWYHTPNRLFEAVVRSRVLHELRKVAFGRSKVYTYTCECFGSRNSHSLRLKSPKTLERSQLYHYVVTLDPSSCPDSRLLICFHSDSIHLILRLAAQACAILWILWFRILFPSVYLLYTINALLLNYSSTHRGDG